MAPDGEEKAIAKEGLEDCVMKMALTYNIEGNGRTPEGWTRLVTHLSEWSMRDPLAGAQKKCTKLIARRAAKRLEAGPRGRPNSGNSLLPTPPLGPVRAVWQQAQAGQPNAPVTKEEAPHSHSGGKAPRISGSVSLAREADLGPRPGSVMRTSTPQVEVHRRKDTPPAPSKGLSVSAPVVRPDNGAPTAQQCNRSTKSAQGFPRGLEPLVDVFNTKAPNGVAAPSGR